jgi:hypothetical protein
MSERVFLIEFSKTNVRPSRSGFAAKISCSETCMEEA